MKKATIARFVIGGAAIFAAFGLAACGAESGQGASEEIGSSSAALTVNSINTNDAILSGREGAASCVIKDASGNKYLLAATGKTSAGAYLRDALLFDPVNHSWTNFGNITANTSDNRAYAKLVSLSDTKCLLHGGFDGTSDPAASYELTVTFHTSPPSAPTLGVSSAINMNSPRHNFAAFPCGTGKVIAIGGEAKISGTLGRLDSSFGDKTIEIYDGSVWRPATHSGGTATQLTDPRASFGAIKDVTASTNRYLVAFGQGASNKLATIETIDAGSSCTFSSVTQAKPTLATAPTAVVGNVLVRTSTAGATSNFISTAGYDGSALFTGTETLAVTWGSTATNTHVASGVITGAFRPVIVDTYSGTSSDPVVILGGATTDALTAAIGGNNAQEYVPGTGWQTPKALNAKRFDQLAEYLGSSTVYMTAGVDPSLGTPDLLSTETISTP